MVEVSTVRQIQALVRERRRQLALTQERLAGLAGVSRKWLSEFERGTTTAVELPLLLRVLAALSLTVDITAADSAGRAEGTDTEATDEVDLDDLLHAYRSRAIG